jgi:hypothetical protein
MYVGDFAYPGGKDASGHDIDAGTYNVVNAKGSRWGIIPDTLDTLTDPSIEPNFVGFGRFKQVSIYARVCSKCPVDIILTDPDGFTVSKDTPEIPGLLYFSIYDIDENGRPDEMVTIPEKKVGIYSIMVVPEPNALPTDTYSLEATIDGQTMILAQDVQIQNIPAEPYIFESKLNRADFNNDGVVDAFDLDTFVLHWLEDCNYPNWCEGTDLDYSGRVDFVDFAIFAENWLWEKIPVE